MRGRCRLKSRSMASGSALGRRMSVDGEMGGGGWVEAEVQRPARSRLLLEIRDALHTTIRGEASRGLGNVEAARCRLGLRAQHSERRMRKVFCIKGNESQQSAHSPRSGGDLPPEPWTNNANTKHNFNISTAQVQVSQGINPTQGLHKYPVGSPRRRRPGTSPTARQHPRSPPARAGFRCGREAGSIPKEA